jgi:hypothetical protein
LTVTDGTHAAHLKLAGDYAGASFTTASDGHGGTTVVDPHAGAATAAAVASLVGAMAAMGGAAGAVSTSPTAPQHRQLPAIGLAHASGRS